MWLFIFFCREETEIIEGEVVEIQIDRPATGTVGSTPLCCELIFSAPWIILLAVALTKACPLLQEKDVSSDLDCTFMSNLIFFLLYL